MHKTQAKKVAQQESQARVTLPDGEAGIFTPEQASPAQLHTHARLTEIISPAMGDEQDNVDDKQIIDKSE